MILHERTNEELISMIWHGECIDAAYSQLFLNLRPMICKIAYKHLRPIPIYDEDDYFQEGCLVIWKLISEKKYTTKGPFSNLFYTAFDHRCINLYRDYVMRNWLLVHENEDFYSYGYQTGYYVQADFVEDYKEKQRQRNRAYYAKMHPNAHKSPPIQKLTEEEKKEKARQKRKAYYEANKEKCLRAKHDWYRKNRAYALQYQKAYQNGVRIGRMGPPKKKQT